MVLRRPDPGEDLLEMVAEQVPDGGEVELLRSAGCPALEQGRDTHQGVILQPTFLVGDDLAAGTLVELMPEFRSIELGIYAVYHTRKHVSPEAGRYQLYVAYICPWACRTLIALRLKGLESAISVCVVDPRLGDHGWQFSGYAGSDLDTVNGARYLHELYTLADPGYTGRATVPVLWDKRERTIVNNESSDILCILNRRCCTDIQKTS